MRENPPKVNSKQENPPKERDYVAAVYEKEWFLEFALGVQEIDENGTKLKYFNLRFTEKKGDNKFIWPPKNDEIFVPEEDILCTVEPPVPVSSRHLGLENVDYKKVKKLFLEYLV